MPRVSTRRGSRGAERRAAAIPSPAKPERSPEFERCRCRRDSLRVVLSFVPPRTHYHTCSSFVFCLRLLHRLRNSDSTTTCLPVDVAKRTPTTGRGRVTLRSPDICMHRLSTARLPLWQPKKRRAYWLRPIHLKVVYLRRPCRVEFLRDMKCTTPPVVFPLSPFVCHLRCAADHHVRLILKTGILYLHSAPVIRYGDRPGGSIIYPGNASSDRLPVIVHAKRRNHRPFKHEHRAAEPWCHRRRRFQRCHLPYGHRRPERLPLFQAKALSSRRRCIIRYVSPAATHALPGLTRISM